jgi:hypothetical protein
MMFRKAVVQHEGGLAHYQVSEDRPGIYQLRLVYYSGTPDSRPPDDLVLVKSLRQWTGSSDRPRLIKELGRSIETGLERNPSPQEDERPDDRLDH